MKHVGESFGTLKKMIHKTALKIRYPKFLLLFVIYAITIIFFYKQSSYLPVHNLLLSFGYFGIFISGFLYAYGFTAAPATVILLALAKQQNYISAGMVGGVGALLSDTLIFIFIRHSFIDEVERLKKEKFIISFGVSVKKVLGSFTHYLLPIVAGLLIASPLPTEVGIALLASMKRVSMKKFLIIAYLLHTLGIFIILFIGKSL